MRYVLLFIVFACFGTALPAQICSHTNLSKDFNFVTHIKKIKREGLDSSVVSVIITGKVKRVVQTITLNSNFLFDSMYFDCNAARSYTMHVNDTVPESDGDYGDIIIADFNFDNREDIALKTDFANSGATYIFYLQNGEDEFERDDFLSDTMGYFPAQINKSNKTLTRISPAGCCAAGETIFQYYPAHHLWREISHRFITD